MRQVSKSVWFFLFVVVVSFVLNLLLFGNPAKQVADNAAPLFQVRFGDAQFDLKKALGNKIILVNFWATWCPPCREEVPLLNELVKSVASPQFELVALMVDGDRLSEAERKKALADFSKKTPIDYPVYVDEDGHIADSYGTRKLPESYLIGADGEIVEKQTGPYTPQDMARLRSKIQAEINKLAAAR